MLALSQSHPILQSKLALGSNRRPIVNRPFLVQQLEARENVALTLITAPAGFGKSTLIREWARQNQATTAGLYLDQHDNTPLTFITYLIAALQTLDPRLGQNLRLYLNAPELPPLQFILTELINDLSAYNKKLNLVLDNYHLIENPQIHQMVDFMLQQMPEFVQLIVAGRSLPPFSLGKLRVRNQLLELDASHLAFSSKETHRFLNSIMKLNVTSEQAKVLETRTEGWVTGLQLAAFSVQKQSNISEFVDRFSGGERYIADFIKEEILEALPEDVQNFLLQTSILEHFSGKLCDAVLQSTHSQKILRTLEKQHMFLVPLDDKRHRFRYHPLFSETLQQLLKERFPQSIGPLHKRAARWHEAQGDHESAAHHALQAKDHSHFMVLFEQVFQQLSTQSRFEDLKKWFQTIPQELNTTFPILDRWKAENKQQEETQNQAHVEESQDLEEPCKAIPLQTTPQSPQDLDALSQRETEVLRLIAQGLSNQKIAKQLYVSLNTIKTHTKNINLKLDVHSRTEAVAKVGAWQLL